jgi:Mrp family chromosome partitioning ATPase
METETKVATSHGVAMLAAKKLGTTTAPDTLSGSLSVSEVQTSAVLTFGYASLNRQGAQQGAQAFADAYLDYRRQQALDDILASSRAIQQQLSLLQSRSSALNNQAETATDPSQKQDLLAQATLLTGQIALLEQNLVQLTPPDTLPVGELLQPANLPSAPSGPNTARNVALGLMMGLGLGIATAILRERLDDRVRGRGDVEDSAQVPVLAVVPKSKVGHKYNPARRLVVAYEPNSAESVAYRKLRTAVLAAGVNGHPMSLMIASSEDDEGRTATAANLAAALALGGKRVTLVSADLRKPRVHFYFRELGMSSLPECVPRRGILPLSGTVHIDDRIGLADVLKGQVGVVQALKQTDIRNLSLLTAGMWAANPTELLGSPAMTMVLSELQDRSDVIIIDVASVLSVADAVTLAPNVDAILLVVESGSTTRQNIEQACQQLQQINAKLMGTVLTNFDTEKAPHYP